MTNENKNLGNDDFKTQDNFSTENHVFHDEKKEHASMFFFLRGGMLEVVT